MKVHIFKAVLVVIFASQAVSGHGFGYSEPNQRRWSRHHGHCAGKTQSPIAISSSRTIPMHMPAVDMVGYHNLLPYPLKMINNGHTVSISIPKLTGNASESEGAFLPYVRGGKLPGEFEVEGVHFHWGDKNNRGSEHVINDIRYTMEMHIVHRNKKYPDIGEALKHPDGAAVLGFMFNLDEDEGLGLVTINRHLHLIEEANKEAMLNVTFSLSSLIANVDVDKFYTYKGSLTTPPCSEAVTWILFPDPIPISPKQISRFRQLSDTQDGALVDNFRQLQPVGNRRIFARIGHVRHTSIAALKNEVDYLKYDWFY
ncbi:carbonic anhydrase 2 [Scaptodrosophila lebanonensis]|uniref:Carbonic anhydrase n=1 Tax=Drosophila lebanonensis TaxID=7225 RepID=A0A6J2T388_DROLE|nr:carbonic anhydrase 2 [Scaptodrosophila lebanonensis]